MNPLVTVIMPVRNEAGFIRKSLGAVLDQDYRDLEILIMDGMSDDGTRAIAAEVAAEHPHREVRVCENPGRVVPVGLNLALAQARGEVIVRVDGHCVIPRDYVKRCVTTLEATGTACVGGTVETIGRTPWARAIARAQSSRFGVGGVAFRTGQREPGPVDTVPFGAYRKEIFDLVGGFDPDLVRNQDDELNYRINRNGGVVWLDPSIRSLYFSRSTLGGLWRQYLGYGMYKVRVIQKTGLTSIRHLVPALFVGGLAASGAASLTWRRPIVGVVLVPYLLASIVASLIVARGELRILPRVPLAYATMHLAYGLGFLAGIWRWRREKAGPRADQSYEEPGGTP